MRLFVYSSFRVSVTMGRIGASLAGAPALSPLTARHIASATDVEQAYAMGKAAVEFALSGKNAVMPIIIRKKGKKYGWKIGEAKLAAVANVEKTMPRNYITRAGFHITEAARNISLH